LSLQLVDQRKLFLATYLASKGSAVDRTQTWYIHIIKSIRAISSLFFYSADLTPQFTTRITYIFVDYAFHDAYYWFI